MFTKITDINTLPKWQTFILSNCIAVNYNLTICVAVKLYFFESHLIVRILKKHAKWDNNTALINILLLTVDQMTLCKEKRFIWKIVVVNFTRQCHCFGFYMLGVGGVVLFFTYLYHLSFFWFSGLSVYFLVSLSTHINQLFQLKFSSGVVSVFSLFLTQLG